ncbi:MAG: ATP-binding cassette domain-containing protein [Deltaproteobacteria bacterium]|jgi:phosphonate transport system ATP-binding protein|nr:ATP-binding cassette domain-containing protein [Deltaproteobacteria bacterium]MBW2496771.1 ATP-binding cassette domain-containing protein [Deltaproteobacteria bacterium]
MTSSAAFLLEDVSVLFGGTAALSNVSLSVQPGEAIAFVGPSGAGKTTLLRLLAGALRPTSGVVSVDGRKLRELSASQLRELRASIGFVHQDLGLVPNLRVVQNVLAGRLGRQSLLASLRSMVYAGRGETREVFALLERVGIPEKLYERTDELSGGQRQRVAIARALYQAPEALLADEPVSSVDPARARDTVALLKEVSQERGITLCMSIHNLELARAFFPRLVGLRGGRIEFDAAPRDVSAEQFEGLYRLAADEMLAEGA